MDIYIIIQTIQEKKINNKYSFHIKSGAILIFIDEFSHYTIALKKIKGKEKYYKTYLYYTRNRPLYKTYLRTKYIPQQLLNFLKDDTFLTLQDGNIIPDGIRRDEFDYVKKTKYYYNKYKKYKLKYIIKKMI